MNTKNKGKICSTEGCGKPAKSKGMCLTCYQRELYRTKAKRQAPKEPGHPQPLRASADIGAMLKPVRANINFLKTRKREITKWLDALTKVVEVLESVR